MKSKKIVLVGVFVFLISVGQEQKQHVLKIDSVQKSFSHANKLYTQNKYQEALERYSTLISIDEKAVDAKSSKRDIPAVWYNMGNCEYMLGNYVQAIIDWSKAKRGASLYKLSDIDYNITIASDKLGVAHAVTLWTKIRDIINFLSLLTLQILVLCLWFLICIVIVRLIAVRSGRGKAGQGTGILRNIIVFCLFSALLASSSALFIKYRIVNYPVAYAKTTTSLFAGPNEKYHQIGNISIADKVVVQKSYKTWYKINHDGVVGWVPSDNVEIV